MLIVFLILWNLLISVLNCWFVGRTWVESKAIGGWFRVVTWSAAVMGACGFIWVNTLVLGYLASTHVGLIPHKYQLTDPYFELLMDIGYLLIIFPVLGSGLMIWLDSIKQAVARKDGISIGVAAYNTFAMADNTYEAAKFLPTVFEKIGNHIDESDNKLMWITIYACLIASVGLGLGTAYYIIHTTAESTAKAVLEAKSVKA